MLARPGRHLIAAALLVFPAAWGVRADDPKQPEHRISVITAIRTPSGIPAGTRCGLALVSETNEKGETVETAYEGKVVKATDEGITLDVIQLRQEVTSRSLTPRIPLMEEDSAGRLRWEMSDQLSRLQSLVVSRLCKNVGIGRPEPGQKIEVFIPSKKIKRIDLSKAGAA